MSKLKELAEDECELEMTSMIDVTFLLLIFFMCTLKFKTLEGKLAAYLPKDVGVNQTQAEPVEKVEILLEVAIPGRKMNPAMRGKQLTVEYDGTGRFVYDSTRSIRYSVGPKRTTNLVELEKRLTELFKKDPERPATIDSRPGTIYEDVIDVLDVALDAGFRDITFVGAYPAPKKAAAN